MVIDCHAHYEPRILSLEKLIKNMDEAGIKKTVLIPLLTDPPETMKSDFLMAVQRFMMYSTLLRPIAITITKSMYKQNREWNLWFNKFSKKTQSFSIVARPNNQEVSEVISRHPERFLGWIFINPCNDNALDELEKYRQVRGMIGIKIHPFWHSFPINKVEKIARRAEELGFPMLVHLGFGESGDYTWLVKRFAKLKIIFAHLGVPFYKDMWHIVKDSPNGFMDIASTYHVNERFVKNAVKAVGPHKCLFGTDSPYAHSDAVVRIKGWVENLTISDSDKEKIFFKNFLDIINR